MQLCILVITPIKIQKRGRISTDMAQVSITQWRALQKYSPMTYYIKTTFDVL